MPITIQRSRTVIVAGCFLFAWSACQSSSSKKIDEKASVEKASILADETKENDQAQSTTASVSDEEAISLGTKLLSMREASDVAGMIGLLHKERFFRRVEPNIDIRKNPYLSFSAGMLNSLEKGDGFFSESGEPTPSCFWKVLGSRVESDGRWVTIRFVGDEEGFEHYGFLVEKDQRGKIGISDYRTMTLGQNFSDLIRPAVASVVSESRKGLTSKLFGKKDEWIKHLPTIQKMQSVAESGDYTKWTQMHEKLPESVKKRIELLILKVHLASNLDDKEYATAIRELLDAYPKSAAAAVASIDYFIIQKDFDQAVRVLDVVKENAFPDANIAVVQANVLTMAGQFDEALRYAEEAVKQEATLEAGYWATVEALLGKKDFDALAETLWVLHEKFGTEFEFEGVPQFEEFLKSDAYPKLNSKLESDEKIEPDAK